MGFISIRKKGVVSLLDVEIDRLRLAYRESRNSKEMYHKAGDREHTANALAFLWPFYEDVTTLLQFLQRMYLAQTAFQMSMRTEVLTREGDRHEAHAILDITKTLVPTSQLKLDGDRKLYENWTLDTDPAAYKAMIQEYCERVAETQGTKVILTVHNPELLKNLHLTQKKMNRYVYASVNYLGRYTYVHGRFFYHKTKMTLPIADLTADALTERAKRYSDSVRLMGEQIEDDGCVYDRSAVNIIMCYILELEWMRKAIQDALLTQNIRIVQQYRKDGNPTPKASKGRSIEPRSYVYHEGIAVTEAVYPILFREISTLNMPNMQKLTAAGLINIDLPLIQFRFTAKSLKLKWHPLYAPLWDKGKLAVDKPINSFMQQLQGSKV